MPFEAARIRLRSLFAAALILAITQAAHSQDLSHLLAADRRVLPNGLEILLHEDHRQRLVTVNVAYHVGEIDEAPGRSGFAHLFEHLMFEGSAHANGSYLGFLGRMNAVDANGFTRDDFTEYFEVLPRENLEGALWLESDRMGFLGEALDDVKLARVKEVVKNERRQKIEVAPYGLAVEAMDSQLFPAPHPFHGHRMGTEADLDRATLAEARTFYETWYVPSNATLTLVGDFQTDEAMRLIMRYFIGLPTRPRPARSEPVPAKLARDVVVRHEEPPDTHAAVFLAWHSPPIFSDGDAAAVILGDVLTRRLERRLMIESRIADQVSVWQGSRPGQSVFTLRAMTAPGVVPEEALERIRRDLEAAARGVIDPEDFKAAQARALTDCVARFDSALEGIRIAEWMQTYNHHRGQSNWFDEDRARYRRVTAQDLSRFVSDVLISQHFVLVIATPRTKDER